jgi:hypothetical protein
MRPRFRRSAPTLVVAAILGGGVAHAQTAQQAQARADALRAPPAAGFAAVLGLVDDSLRGRPLAGAKVQVLGTEKSTTTGPDGIFRLDSMPAGETVLFVKHPFLDTMFVTVISPKLNLVAGKLEQVFVTSPPIDRVRERICPRQGSTAGIAMLAGRVDNADTDQPVANAVVSLVYTDPGAGTTAQKLRTVRTRADGFYVICGLPETYSGAVQAAFGAVSSSEITIDHKADLLSTASFILGSTAAADTGRRGKSVLRGRVTDVTGKPLSGVQVAVEGGNQIATSGEDGLFSLEGLASGTTNAVIRKIGFSPAYRTVHLRGTQPQSVSVALTPGVRTLATVNVTTTLDPALKKVGFTDRRMMGLRSNFLLPEDVAKRQAGKTTDLFRNMTGFRVTAIGTGAVVESTRMSPGSASGCVSIFVDRVAFEQMAPGDLDTAYPIHHIAAVEGYASATDTPAEFRMSGKGCATIVLWTKHRLSKP